MTSSKGSDHRPQGTGPWIAAFLLLMALLYVGGYFVLGNAIPIYQTPKGFTPNPTNGSKFMHVSRFYRTSFETALFSPLGRIESCVRGIDVQLQVSPIIPDIEK